MSQAEVDRLKLAPASETLFGSATSSPESVYALSMLSS